MTALLSIIPWDWVTGALGLILAFLGIRWQAKREARKDMELRYRREQDSKRAAARKAEREARGALDNLGDDDLDDRLRGDGWGTE